MSDKSVAIGISNSVQVDERSNLVFQTHVPLDCSAEYFNSIADKLRNAAIRQQAFFEIKNLQKELKVRKHQLKDLKEDVDRLDRQAEREQVSGSSRLQARSKDEAVRNAAARDNALATLNKAKEHISRIEQEIVEQEAIYNATSSSANCCSGNTDS